MDGHGTAMLRKVGFAQERKYCGIRKEINKIVHNAVLRAAALMRGDTRDKGRMHDTFNGRDMDGVDDGAGADCAGSELRDTHTGARMTCSVRSTEGWRVSAKSSEHVRGVGGALEERIKLQDSRCKSTQRNRGARSFRGWVRGA